MKRSLQSPRVLLLALALACVLLLPSLRVWPLMDDAVHAYIQRDPSWVHATPGSIRYDLFRFADHDRERTLAGLRDGLWPWWTAEDYRLAFCRPLASLTHAFDYRVLGGATWLMHVESLALYLLCIVLVHRLARRWLAPLGAGVATVVFAVEDAHAMPVTWLANRNLVLAALFSLLALERLSAPTARRTRAYLVAVCSFLLALASGEAGVSCLGLIGAYLLFVDDRPSRSRLLAAAPFGLVLLLWALLVRSLGYGTHGGGFYIDPLAEVGTFLGALVVRLPILLAAQLTLIPADLLANLSPAQLQTMGGVCALVVGALLAWLWPLFKRSSLARFGLLAMALTAIPVCATWPTDRVLFFPSIGAAFVWGALFDAEAVRLCARRVLLGMVVVVHMLLPLLLLPARVWILNATFHNTIVRAAKTLPDVPERSLIVVNTPDFLNVSNAAAVRALEGGHSPYARARVLAICTQIDCPLRRLDARTLEIQNDRGFVADPISQVFRRANLPFEVGWTIDLGDVRVTVVEVLADGRPKTVHYTFDSPLESDDYTWISWKDRAYAAFTLPAVGETMTIPAVSLEQAYAP